MSQENIIINKGKWGVIVTPENTVEVTRLKETRVYDLPSDIVNIKTNESDNDFQLTFKDETLFNFTFDEDNLIGDHFDADDEHIDSFAMHTFGEDIED